MRRRRGQSANETATRFEPELDKSSRTAFQGRPGVRAYHPFESSRSRIASGNSIAKVVVSIVIVRDTKRAWPSTCYCSRNYVVRPLCFPVVQTLLDSLEIGRLGKELIDAGLGSGMTVFGADESGQGNDDQSLVLWQFKIGFALTNC